jgi:tetratricopeptide (TPR) repeat protein
MSIEAASSSRIHLLSAALLLMVAIPGAGCRKKVAIMAPPPPPPPAPSFLAIGDAAYAARNFSGAVEAYENFLKANAQAPERDRALFRIAMAYSVKESPLHDAARALESFRQVATAHPNSPYATEAKLYLNLNEELTAQQQAVAERSRRIEELESGLAALKMDNERAAEELLKIKTDTAKREERIRQVTAELERLKAIDMQRRPTKPVR